MMPSGFQIVLLQYILNHLSIDIERAADRMGVKVDPRRTGRPWK
jgi:hypothetical protein